jgi:FemAB-related protein (PEP-CTERM system-associated)
MMNTRANSAVEPSAPLDVGLAGPAEREALDDYVLAEPRASHYHLSGWRHLVGEVFGHETWCLRARGRDGTINGVLPLVRLRSRLFGDFLVSMPYFNHGGAIGSSDEVESRLMREATGLAADLGVRHVEFRDSRRREGEYLVREDKVRMVLPLPGTTEELWRDVGSKVRAQVKRPLREGAGVVRGGPELLPEFYQVFARNMRDLGTPVYGRRFFTSILVRFPEAASVTVVRLRDRPVAAALLLHHRETLEVPWASSLREYNGVGANMLLYWALLEQAVGAGCREFDFGRSSREGGTWRFKKQWGAEERPLFWHYWVAPGQGMPGLRTDNPKFALAIRAWQRLPLAIANRLGPLIVKNLP